MSKKPLVIIDQDPEFKLLKANLDNGYELFEEVKEFMKKQAEDSWKKLVLSQWANIEKVLKERSLLPDDYSDDQYSLGFADGVLYLQSKDEKEAGLRSIFEMLFNK